MDLLILGGSDDHLGGVEAFCERSQEALATRGTWQAQRIATSTAYLTIRRLPRVARGLAALVRARGQKPDLVWLQYVNLPDLSYLLAARLLGLRVMVTPHLGANWRSQEQRGLRTISRTILARAQRLALISPTQEQEIALPRAVPRSAIRNFLSADILAATLTPLEAMPPELQLIHSGRLSEGKGTFLFVEVCAGLAERGVPFFARITGGADGATMERLHALIARHGLQDKVAVLGRVPDEELIDCLKASDVLVHLSRIDSYPLIVLEAMACSMLPICMELAGARDMVEQYDGAIVSAANPVAETVEILANASVEDVRARGRVQAGRVREDYSWQRCAAALDAALTACLAGRRVPVSPAEPAA
jgi:glycosyltransferase involved in cell wall biosynthesis